MDNKQKDLMKNIKICKLVRKSYKNKDISFADSEYQVEISPGYGVICPGLVTSNGAIGIVANAVIDCIYRLGYIVEDSILPLDVFETEEKFIKEVKKLIPCYYCESLTHSSICPRIKQND